MKKNIFSTVSLADAQKIKNRAISHTQAASICNFVQLGHAKPKITKTPAHPLGESAQGARVLGALHLERTLWPFETLDLHP